MIRPWMLYMIVDPAGLAVGVDRYKDSQLAPWMKPNKTTADGYGGPADSAKGFQCQTAATPARPETRSSRIHSMGYLNTLTIAF